MAKAQELTTGDRIDRTMLESRRERERVKRRRSRAVPVWLEDPYLEAKSPAGQRGQCEPMSGSRRSAIRLLHRWSDTPRTSTATDLLFTSLLMQAAQRITALGNDVTLGRRARKADLPPVLSAWRMPGESVFACTRRTKPRPGRLTKLLTPPPAGRPPGGEARCRCQRLCSASWES